MNAVIDKTLHTRNEDYMYISCLTGMAFCAVHRPANATQSHCVVFLNAGLQNRAGPQRLYVQAARRFSDEGFLCVRVDLPGVGDSLGQLSATHFDTYNPEDVLAILDHLQSELGIDSFHLLGLCAGARVATKSTRDARVVSLIAYGLPILSCPPEMPKSPEAIAGDMSEIIARTSMRRQIGNLFKPSVWKRFFFAGGTIRSAASKLINTAKHVGNSSSGHKKGPFLIAFEALMKSTKPVLFVYGEMDRNALAELVNMYPDLTEGGDDIRRLIKIPAAGHTLSTVNARVEAIQSTLDWIKQH